MFQVLVIIFDLFMAVLMFFMGRYFYHSKGKASNLLTGYNMRPENERKQFDGDAMCRIYGKRIVGMAVPFVCGAAIDFFKPGIGCTAAWIVWTVLFVMLCIKRTSMEKKQSSEGYKDK